MKRTSLFALLAIAALALFSSAPLAASPPDAVTHPAQLAWAPPSAAIVSNVPLAAPAAGESVATLDCFASYHAAFSVPGLKRVGAEPSTVLTPTSATERLPPPRAVPLAAG